MTDTDEVLFAEAGSRWWPVWLAPGFAAVGLISDAMIGDGMPVFVWLVAAVVVGAVVALIVYAARRHTSVELTAHMLRLGEEEVDLDEIVHVMPEPVPGRGKHDPREPWESARSLGGLSVVPRGRNGIGVRMRSGALRQAWAKDDRGLRAQLEPLISARRRARKGPRRKDVGGRPGGETT